MRLFEGDKTDGFPHTLLLGSQIMCGSQGDSVSVVVFRPPWSTRNASMTYRITVGYREPADPKAFDDYYRNTHVPIARACLLTSGVG
jgi:hypothetical protein